MLTMEDLTLLGLTPLESGDEGTVCRWFFLCDNMAVGYRQSILINPPCCERCAKIGQ